MKLYICSFMLNEYIMKYYKLKNKNKITKREYNYVNLQKMIQLNSIHYNKRLFILLNRTSSI